MANIKQLNLQKQKKREYMEFSICPHPENVPTQQIDKIKNRQQYSHSHNIDRITTYTHTYSIHTHPIIIFIAINIIIIIIVWLSKRFFFLPLFLFCGECHHLESSLLPSVLLLLPLLLFEGYFYILKHVWLVN